MAVTINGTTGITTPDITTEALTTTGDVSFGDNDKAIFGAGSDLQIHHDGSNSFINDTGTGNLIVRGVNVTVQDSTTKQYFSTNESTGVATLFHNSNAKLATTSSGVSVTGVVSSEASTNNSIVEYKSGGNVVGNVYHDSNSRTSHHNVDKEMAFYRTTSNGAYGFVKFQSDVGGAKVEKAEIRSNGDIYNSNGTYGTLSDETTKQQISNATSQWDDIQALQVRKYKLNADVEANGSENADWHIGVVAQELESSGMNGLVMVREDGLKQVKMSVLYMKAVKALQEAMDRIETLETTVADLQTRVTALEAN